VGLEQLLRSPKGGGQVILSRIIENNRERITWQANRIKHSNGTPDRCLVALVEWFARTFWNELDDETTVGDLKAELKQFCE
jgi:hypothetical protein